MGQFKPMVKMMTTEPTVELKLKKGGHVNMKKGGKAEAGHKKMADGGGAMGALAGTPALIGRPAVNAPVRAPGKPSMAARRKAMAPKAPIGNPAMPSTPMKNGGESKATHKAEMSKMKGLEKELKSHESKPASKGHKGLATGGVALGQGGYKKGGNVKKYAKGGVAGNGVIPESASAKGAGPYRNTEMHTAEYTGKSSGKTGGVKNGNGGGYKTGGVALGNGGGFQKGGKVEGAENLYVDSPQPGGDKRGGAITKGRAAKKAYATGGTVDSGKPVAMPQGSKKPPTPVSINRLTGTYKSGGKVTPAQGRLQANFKAENATAMKEAKADTNLKYSKYQKMADGGKPVDLSKGAYDASKKHSMELEDALNPFSMVKELAGKAKDYFMPKGESVTKTKESVTVAPVTKKRGGGAC